MTPDISVIVPCFNAERYLGEALKSLRIQRKPQIEMIFIDDGSTDRTGAMLDAFAAEEERARVFHIANRGVSNARNLGLEKAEGEYVAFLDADDCYEMDAFYTLWSEAKRTGAQIVSGVHAILTEQGTQRLEPDAAACRPEDVVRKIIRMHRIYNNVWNKLYLRSLFSDEVRFDPTVKIGEDALVNLQLFHLAEKTEQLQAETYLYRVHEQSAMANSGKYCEAHLPMLKGMDTLLCRYRIKERYFRDFLFSAVWFFEKETGILYAARVFNRSIRPMVLSGVDPEQLHTEDRSLYRIVKLGFFPVWYCARRIFHKLSGSGR